MSKLNRIKLNGSNFTLTRDYDKAGDSGPMFKAIDKDGKNVGETGEIIVGCCMLCGSVTARSYQYQDWWLTTPVTKIIDVNSEKTRAVVETKNSTYVITTNAYSKVNF